MYVAACYSDCRGAGRASVVGAGCSAAQGQLGQGGRALTGVPGPWAVKTCVFWVFLIFIKKS